MPSLAASFLVAAKTNHKELFDMAANKKVSPKDLPYSLTKDTDIIKAMKAIQRAGFWATLGGGFVILWYIFTIFMSDAGLNQLVIYAPWATYLFWSGYRLNRLKGNTSLLALLIINTIIGGLISLQAIFSILALFKYGTYRDWYETANTSNKLGGKPVASEGNKGHRSVALPVAIVVSTALVLMAGIGGWVYINQQQIDQKNRELTQQKELKEQELKALKDVSSEEAEAIRDAARKQCLATQSSGDWFYDGYMCR